MSITTTDQDTDLRTDHTEFTQFKEYNDLNNKIRDAIPTKLQSHLQLSLPRIASCGSQSSGKSSILSQMTGIRFPRNAGTCTRVPIELRLESHKDEYKAEIDVKWCEEDSSKAEYNEAEEKVIRLNERLLERVKDYTTFVDEVEQAISDAQNAIIDLSMRDFSSSVIIITAHSPGMPNLTLIDLPGIVAHMKGDSRGLGVVEALYEPYLSDPSTVILAVFPGETDYETQSIWNEINKHDQNRERTIGVITKADRIEPGTEKQWMELVEGEKYHMILKNGWYVTKSVRQQDISSMSQSQALEEENDFFSRGVWKDFGSHRSQLGTENLRSRMSNLLFERMRLSLPTLKIEAEILLRSKKAILDSLGEEIPASDDEKLARLKEKIDELVQSLRVQFGYSAFSESPARNTFYAEVKKIWHKFKIAVRDLGPGRSSKKTWRYIDSWVLVPQSAVAIGVIFDTDDHIDMSGVSLLMSGVRFLCSGSLTFKLGTAFIFHVPSTVLKDAANITVISPGNQSIKRRMVALEEPDAEYRTNVMTLLTEATDNERIMIGERSTDVTPALCNEFIKTWEQPSRVLVNTMHRQEMKLVDEQVAKQFSQFTEMQRAVRGRAHSYLDALKEQLWFFVQSLHDAEMKHKHTLNDHYFYETKMRYNTKEPTEEEMLHHARELTGNYRLESITDTMRKHLKAVGLKPEDSFEKHIDDAISTVVAYHKCAYKRYVESCHLMSSKVFFNDFLDKMRKDLWNDVRQGNTLDALFSESPQKVLERKNTVDAIEALTKILKVLKETQLVF